MNNSYSTVDNFFLFQEPTRTRPVRATEEWMLICQRNADLQPEFNSDDGNWSESSNMYSNLEELPTFLSRHRQTAAPRTYTTTADPQLLQGKQLQAYKLVRQHFESDGSPPLRLIVSGTAGTGKSFLINCLRLLLNDKLRVAAPTGVAAFNVDGGTLHSLLSLPTKGEFKELEGERLHKFQQSLADMKYLIIDEMSMVGRKMFGQVDKRLRQVFPHRSDQVLGGCSCLLFGDFGQLPPVMDLPLYATSTRSALSDLGSNAYQQFDKAIVLDQVMRQSGQSASQVLFRDILLRLRDASVTEEDWRHLMTRTQARVSDVSSFADSLRLFPTTEAVVEYNVSKLQACGQPIATIKAVHTGPNAAKASPDDASGLEAIICLAVGARVMLSSNLWVEMGLVNGAMGTIKSICYRPGGGPPELPVAVTVIFDAYSGPTLPDGSVPICPLRRTCSMTDTYSTRLQLPLKLAWAITIHKAQGLTLDSVVVDIGKKDFSLGLSFVACSRVRTMANLLLHPPFSFQRLSNLSKSRRLQERKLEDVRLSLIELTTIDRSTQSTASPSYRSTLMDDCHTDDTPSPIIEYSPTPSPPMDDYQLPSSPLTSIMEPSSSTPSPPSWIMDSASPTPSPPSWITESASPTPSPPSWIMESVSPTPYPPSWIMESVSPTPSPPS